MSMMTKDHLAAANTRSKWGVVTALATCFICSGCLLQADADELDAVLKHGPVGGSPDYYLVKRNTGIDDRVAVFFGYSSDLEACQQFADAYAAKYPLDKYACVPAN